MYANFSCMALDHAFGTSTEQETDWVTGWMVFRLECSPTKLSSPLAAKMARIVLVVLTKPGALYERRDPAFT